MKKIAVTVGIVLLLVGIYQGGRYFMDYNTLTQYGKGFVWGSGLLFIIGILLIYFGLRKKKTRA